MNVITWIMNTIFLALGAYILWTITNSLVSINPEYGYYGWGIMGAYFAATVLYIKHSMKSNSD